MTRRARDLEIQVSTSWDEMSARAWRGVVHPNRDHVFMTLEYQRAWWESFSPGELLIISISRDQDLLAIAPLFVSGGMAFFVGSGGSDYLDFVGSLEPGVLCAILGTARAAIPGFVGFRFHHVPDSSPTGSQLTSAASHLGLTCFDEGSLAAPRLTLTAAAVDRAANKRSLLRHERWLRNNGDLAIDHMIDTGDILDLLPSFFRQHQRRWAGTPFPSLFDDPQQQDFYRRLVPAGSAAGWLRFTTISWNGAPVAFHFGFSHAGSYLWYKPSFDIELARRSPGEVLLRQLVLAAAEEKCHTFDFGIGEEAFKQRFADGAEQVRTWALYPGGTP